MLSPKIKNFLHLRQLYNVYLNLIDANLIPWKKTPNTLIKFSTATKLINHFGGAFGHGVNSKTGNLGFGLIHYSIVNTLRPERILCIGSERGFIPAILALACKDNHYGHVDFVDAGKNTSDSHNWGGIGLWKNVHPQKYFSDFNINKYLTTYVTTSQVFAQKYPQRKYEYIYIDGDHSYQGVKNDYDLYWPRLATRGFICFHDIYLKGLSHGEEFGVWKLWQELKSSHKFTFDTFDNALGFIQKVK